MNSSNPAQYSTSTASSSSPLVTPFDGDLARRLASNIKNVVHRVFEMNLLSVPSILNPHVSRFSSTSTSTVQLARKGEHHEPTELMHHIAGNQLGH
jgi:hypothetical protein